MFILANKNTKKVIEILDKKPLSYSNNLLLLEISNLPEKFDYLTIENVREMTEKHIDVEFVEETNEKGEKTNKSVEVEKQKSYLTCDLIVGFNGDKVLTDAQKEKLRNNKIVGLIREKYSLDEELSILRQKDSKPNKFNEYFSYVEECVSKVPKQ